MSKKEELIKYLNNLIKMVGMMTDQEAEEFYKALWSKDKGNSGG
jgi:hypothetical protein